MLATLVDKPVNEPRWLYEVKWVREWYMKSCRRSPALNVR